MATDGTFSALCTHCSKDDKLVEAVNQCLDCNEYYCVKCIHFHDKFATTSDHKVVDKKQMRKVQGSKPKIPLPTQRCQDHHERITTYCADDDATCCNTCVSISHRNCNEITYIVDVAQGIKSGSQLKSAKTNITATLKNLKKEIISCKKYKEDLDNDKTATVQQVKDLTKRLIKRIRELEKLTVKRINSEYEDQSHEAGADVTHLNGVISVLEEDLENLDQSQQNSESTVFVDVKLGQRHESEGLKILQQVNAHRNADSMLVLKTDMETFLNELTSLGNFPDVSNVYTAKLKSEYNIKVQQDTTTCSIVESTLLPDGTVVVTDWNNKRIKRLDASYGVTDYCDMPDCPYGVTCTAPDKVAVTLTTNKKVQFVSVRDSMSLTRSFSTVDTCRGIVFSKGELFVACGGGGGERQGHVTVYNLKGAHLRTIQTGPSGEQIFSLPLHITASADGTRIYVADTRNGVVTSDRKGKSVSAFTDPSLNVARGLCHLDNGNVLVCGMESHNVLQCDSNGKRWTELLNNTDDIKYPKSLCYNSSDSRLVVTTSNTDTIKVFVF